MKCNCYVSRLSDYKRFVIRYGAHELDCPVYRASRDPHDNTMDCYTRKYKGTNYRSANFNNPSGSFKGE